MFLQLAKNLEAKISPHSQAVQIHDQYVDTPENFFQNSKHACRIRLIDADAELTLKRLSRHKHHVQKDGIFVRDEKIIKLPKLASNKAALDYCRNNFFVRMQPLFAISNSRQIDNLTLPCGTRAEASYDQVVMSCGKKKHRMHEIELEFKSGQLQDFKAFIDKLSVLPLNFSKSSKFEIALENLSVASSVSSSCIQDFFHDLANHILKVNFNALKKCEAAVLLDLPEAIHDMRVAIRRLRAALKTFKETLPAKAKKVRAKLQTLFRVLGEKRDLDIFAEFIAHTLKVKSDPFSALVKQLNEAQHHVIAMLQSKFYVSLVEALEQLKAVENRKNQDILSLLRKRIQKALDNVIEIVPSLDEADDGTLHLLRIAIKKMRYICEFFEPLFSKYICSLEPMIKKTKKIQTILGEHQNAIAGLAMLNDYKNLLSSKEYIQLRDEYQLKKQKHRESFFKFWKSFWFGTGFIRSGPATALELILE